MVEYHRYFYRNVFWASPAPVLTQRAKNHNKLCGALFRSIRVRDFEGNGKSFGKMLCNQNPSRGGLRRGHHAQLPSRALGEPGRAQRERHPNHRRVLRMRSQPPDRRRRSPSLFVRLPYSQRAFHFTPAGFRSSGRGVGYTGSRHERFRPCRPRRKAATPRLSFRRIKNNKR